MPQFSYRDPLMFAGGLLKAIVTNEQVEALLQTCAENPAFADRSKPLVEVLPPVEAATEEVKEVTLDFGAPKRASDVRVNTIKEFKGRKK
jgi:hypothetical protein